MRKNGERPAGLKTGFTLVELLVVIAIISLLAAILFPVFARARENARRTTCQSNIRNIAMGIRQYAQDYDEVFPLVAVNSAASGGVYGWADAIQPYLKVSGIYQCLSEKTEPLPGPTQYGYIDYFFNSSLSGQKEAEVTSAPNTILNGDGQIGSSSEIGTARYAIDGGSGGSASSPVLADLTNGYGQRHFSGSDYSFADGHVKWIRAINPAQSGVIYDSTSPPTGNNITFARK